jgi:hypothetical protein
MVAPCAGTTERQSKSPRILFYWVMKAKNITRRLNIELIVCLILQAPFWLDVWKIVFHR